MAVRREPNRATHLATCVPATFGPADIRIFGTAGEQVALDLRALPPQLRHFGTGVQGVVASSDKVGVVGLPAGSTMVGASRPLPSGLNQRLSANSILPSGSYQTRQRVAVVPFGTRIQPPRCQAQLWPRQIQCPSSQSASVDGDFETISGKAAGGGCATSIAPSARGSASGTLGTVGALQAPKARVPRRKTAQRDIERRCTEA